METKIIKGASIDQKREILNSNKGQYFSVDWVKKDGEPASRVVRQWTDKALVYGKEMVMPSTAAGKPDLYQCADVAKLAAEDQYPWVTVTLSNLKSARIGGVEYIFED